MAGTEDVAVVRLARRRYWREADARVVVAAWHRSELSLAGFARRYGLKAQRLAHWRARLERDESDERQREAVTFHPVQLLPARSGAVSGAAIEIVLTAGRVVRVPNGVAPADLRAALTAVRDVF